MGMGPAVEPQPRPAFDSPDVSFDYVERIRRAIRGNSYDVDSLLDYVVDPLAHDIELIDL